MHQNNHKCVLWHCKIALITFTPPLAMPWHFVQPGHFYPHYMFSLQFAKSRGFVQSDEDQWNPHSCRRVNQAQKSSFWCVADMEFVKNFTPPDFQAKNLTPSISPNFSSFSKKKHTKWVKMEKFTPLAKILHCRRQWRQWQIPPLSRSWLFITIHKPFI